jgi:hypothetical protein
MISQLVIPAFSSVVSAKAPVLGILRRDGIRRYFYLVIF